MFASGSAPLALLLLAVRSAAIPEYIQVCKAWEPGMRGYMWVEKLMDGSKPTKKSKNGACWVEWPYATKAFVGGQTYDVTMRSEEPMLFKFHSTDGTCLGNDGFDSLPGSLKTARNFSWTAPTERSSVEFYALCAPGQEAIYAVKPLKVHRTNSLSPSAVAGGDVTMEDTETAETLSDAVADVVTEDSPVEDPADNVLLMIHESLAQVHAEVPSASGQWQQLRVEQLRRRREEILAELDSLHLEA
eukprot:TRINITY_DN32516_c0_g1_i1.p1 TRINITY_DN32516_c0_g1~~TRINITY_DN32516_c0_g1_i1.p1  ORF type:complete len:245 (+),score=52.16 TRINITY_DN32516_c0_g1_i1:57-791(+)